MKENTMRELTIKEQIDELKTAYSYREISDLTEEAGHRISHVHIYRIHKDKRDQSLTKTEAVINQVYADFVIREIGNACS